MSRPYSGDWQNRYYRLWRLDIGHTVERGWFANVWICRPLGDAWVVYQSRWLGPVRFITRAEPATKDKR